MKLFLFLIILYLLQSCSFDDKSGIWKNDSFITEKKEDVKDGFNDLVISSDTFNQIILINNKKKFTLSTPKNTKIWQDIYFNKSNNSENFSFSELNQLNFISKKITSHPINNFILFKDNNLILSDQKGNVIIFNTINNKIIKFNFYKKKFKKIKKYLNFHLENNFLYISDNLGYLYNYDLINKKVIWAKNYNVPFSGNLKIIENKLITSNLNNNLIFYNKYNGNILKSIPTEETIIKNQFKNNISLDYKNLYFLNTFGSLYSVNVERMTINWFVNISNSSALNPNNLFNGSIIINKDNRIIVSSDNQTFMIDTNSGNIINKFNFSSQIKPTIVDKYLFIITKNHYLVVIDYNSGEIIFSSDINQDLSDLLQEKKRKILIGSLNILENKIYIFLKNSFYLKYDLNGRLLDVNKLPTKINSELIFVNNSILFVNNRNKLVIVN